MDNLKAHRLATLFPEVIGEEFDQLVADIKRGGLLEPVWLYEGKVLDGWHRYRAAKKAGVAIKTRTWRGSDPMAFVVSMNIMRRHLNESQRAMLLVQAAEQAGKLIGQDSGDEKSRQAEPAALKSQQQLAREIHVGERTVRRAVRVMEKPELARKVVAGELSLDEADRRMRPKPKPSPTKAWQDAPEVKSLVQAALGIDKRVSAFVPEMKAAVRAGKPSPEARRFVAAKIRPSAKALAELADWLEG